MGVGADRSKQFSGSQYFASKAFYLSAIEKHNIIGSGLSIRGRGHMISGRGHMMSGGGHMISI